MDTMTATARLSASDLERILEVTRRLAAPFDLATMLGEVVEAGKNILRADSGTLWLYEAATHELVMRIATGIEPVRLPADRGIVGECARTRAVVNVPDCYADPRFNPDIDRATGYRTRTMLTVPLVGHDGHLVGVLQMLNRRDGAFDAGDERVALTLGAQCAVALERVQMTETRLLSEKLRQEIAVAREIQVGTLPRTMPGIPGYEIFGMSRPAEETGGDTFDLVALDDGRLFMLLADATGHGVGPALSATQVRAMLRVALRLGAGLDAVFRHINNQLVDDLPDDRFVTAFLGVLDPARDAVEFHAGGQGPILHYRAADKQCRWHDPTTIPLGFLPHDEVDPAHRVELAPGDVLGLISDGIYEYENPRGELFGNERVAALFAARSASGVDVLGAELLASAERFAEGAPQADDVTVVLVRRLPAAA
jgi:sigma-B regulation protein RsbU (phosphoserine phosphatase)